MPDHRVRYKLPLVSLVLILLLSYPLLSIVNVPKYIGGIPLLYFFVFLVWFIAIVVLFIGHRPKKEDA